MGAGARNSCSIAKKITAGIGPLAAALGSVVVAGPPAAANGKWCNHSVCIETYDTGTYLGRVYRDQAYPQRHFPAGTRLCAEGFRGGTGVGLPCVTLTN
ncbi:hypothetical protein [Streptomyces sp. NPDC050988]|uniref:hypothetical protein n=1 Tax=Streptomyces sp. NPDC050988 TaxID=3365637 RepID=UPI00379ED061